VGPDADRIPRKITKNERFSSEKLGSGRKTGAVASIISFTPGIEASTEGPVSQAQVFRRTVQDCTLILVLYRMYSVLVILPELPATASPLRQQVIPWVGL
jgi:hypothetical protein